MIFKRINDDTPEQVFIVAKNSWSTASLSNGDVVQWDYTTDVDGVGVTKPTGYATSFGFAVAGVAAQTITAGSYGLIQVYGYHSAVRVRASTGAAAITKGNPLCAGAAAGFMLENFNTGHDAIATLPCAIALEAYTSWTTTTMKCILKCL